MDEIEYKLKTNDNILISSAVSKLIVSIKNIGDSEKVKDSNEFKLLQESCMSSNALLSITSCHGLMILAQDGALDFNYIISTILSSALSSNGVISALGQLLILDMKIAIQNSVDQNYVSPFNMNAPEHPFITILIKKESAWNDILNQVDTILNDDTFVYKHKIEFLRPVLLHILVNLSNSIENKNRLQIWKLLLRELESLDVQKVIVETLMWNKIEFESNCSFISVLCIELIERALLLDIPQLYMPIVPYLVSLIPNLLSLGADPKPSIVIVSKVLQKHKFLVAVDQICMILAECISISPSVYLYDLILLCFNILHYEAVNFIATNSIVSSILQWMAYSSCLTDVALKKALELKQYIEMYRAPDKITCDDFSLFHTIKYFSATLLKYSNLTEISLFYHKDLSSLNNFLDTLLQNNNSQFIYKIKFFLFGIFMCNLDTEIILKSLKLLVIAIKENCRLAVGLLTLILYKLAHESDAKIQIELLRTLPQMAVVKENIPLIIHTLCSLKKGPITLQSLCIDLQMRLCNIDVRCYPYLQESLMETYPDDSARWYIDIVKADSIKQLCLARPEHHGSELVAHISQLLNRCTDSRGAFPSSLALEAILHLSNAGVVDIISTWHALSPRFNNEKRPRVIVSLCKLFATVPTLSIDSTEHQELVTELVGKLWTYVTDHNEKEIVEAALMALSNFPVENIDFKNIPEEFKQNIKLPYTLSKAIQDDSINVEALSYIPGECWIRLLQNINRIGLQQASELISKWMSEEISQYRSGVYMVLPGKGEPNDCSNLPHKSIVRAVIEFVLEQTSKKTISNFETLEKCLYILSKSYDKPLPPVNWCCLHDLYHLNEKYRNHCVNIATKQMVISGSAKRFVENYLNDFDPEKTVVEETTNLLKNLPNYCKYLNVNIIKQLTSKTIDFILKKSLSNKENGNELLEQFLKYIKLTLKAEDVQDDCKAVLAQNLELLFDKIHQDDKIFLNFADCCLDLPILYFDRMTAPSMWWETVPSKLCKAVVIRCAMSMQLKDDGKALVWLNEIIDTGARNSHEQQNYILIHIMKVMKERHDEQYIAANCEWILELMGHTQAVLIKMTNNDEKSVQKSNIHFLCDVLMLSLECLSGVSCFVSNEMDKLVTSSAKFDLFPTAISILSFCGEWKDTLEQIIEWLYFMYTSPMIAPNYLTTFKKALMASKTHPTFGKKHLWSKVIQETCDIF